MDFAELSQRIADAFPGLSPQLQRAAHHVLHHPDDVALQSMRRLATDAGVRPSTMVRLAHQFGFARYSGFRDAFQSRLRLRPKTYLDRARTLQARGAETETPALLKELQDAHALNLRECFETNAAEKFQACAEVLNRAERIFIVGLRSCFPVAFFFHHVYRMFRRNTVLLDGRSGTLPDDLRILGQGDVLFAISMHPYSQATVKALQYARRKGASTVVLTDSPVSPLAETADNVLIVSNETPSFFYSVAPLLMAVEALIILLVAQGGELALAAIAESERQLESFESYWNQGALSSAPPPRRRRSSTP